MRRPNQTFASLVLSAIVLLMLSCAIVYADEATDQSTTDTGNKIYKHIGPNGEIIYTDKATPGSEEVKVLPPPSSYKPVTPPTNFTPYQPEPNTPPTKPIENSVTITAPTPEQSIWSGSGEVTVSVSLASGLASGQQLEYQIDGATVLTSSETSHTFSKIYRGAHILTVRITDKAGNSVTSPPITFYMHRPSQKN